MPKYSVRFYTQHVDEYIVEAESEEAAEKLAESYEQFVSMPVAQQTLQAKAYYASRIVHHFDREYTGSDEAIVEPWEDNA